MASGTGDNGLVWESSVLPRQGGITGRPLAGEKLVRFVYLDEAGTELKEVTVVGGVIVHADLQWKPAAEAIVKLLEEVPEQYRSDFIFHGKEIFGGYLRGGLDVFGVPKGKKIGIDEKIWPLPARTALWCKLLSIPREIGLPVVWAFARPHESETANPKAEMILRHALVFTMCIGEANRRIKQHCPREIAAIVAEDVPDKRRYLRAAPGFLKAGNTTGVLEPGESFDAIVDTVHLTEKHSAPLLQLADAVAYTVRRYLGGYSHGEEMMLALLGQKTIPPKMPNRENAGTMTLFWPKKTPMRFSSWVWWLLF